MNEKTQTTKSTDAQESLGAKDFLPVLEHGNAATDIAVPSPVGTQTTTFEIQIYGALCATSIFKINEIDADSCDFGSGYDESPEPAEDYACGNRVFEKIVATNEVLEKYKITEADYEKIADELVEKLSFGCCGWCV